MTVDMKWTNCLKKSVKVQKQKEIKLIKNVPSHPIFKKSWAGFFKILGQKLRRGNICKYTNLDEKCFSSSSS